MEFLGLEVEGVSPRGRGDRRVEQYDVEHFKAAVAAILESEIVDGIAWTQYTPYFNDGEPCVFSASDPYFSFVGISSEDTEDEYFDYSWMEDDFEETGRVWAGQWSNRELFEKYVGKTEKNWGEWAPRGQREFTWKDGSGPDHAPNPALFNAIVQFQSDLDGGHYDHAVEDLFGDHAIVKIDKRAGKVIVDEYYHD